MEKPLGYTIKITNFEGPLDLLFHLIEKNKMDIYDIQITEIADQYIEYLNQMEQLDLEVASEFLVMASTLLLIKSRLLLPKPSPAGEDVEDLKDQLINSLIQYKKYKEFTKGLKEREAYYGQMFYKAHEVFKVLPVKAQLKDYLPGVIPEMYAEILRRNANKINLRNREVIKEILVREKVTIRSKIKDIVKLLLSKAKFKFSELFSSKETTKIDVVTSFMAILELAKAKKVSLKQKESFGEIEIKKIKAAKEDNEFGNSKN